MVWVLIYAAFVCVAFSIRTWMAREGVTEIWGWDYGTFVSQINDWSWITYTGFRHPGLGAVLSPLVALQHIWSSAYLWFMPAIATVTAWSIWKLSGWVGLGVWLSFPTTWIMASIPESFPIAQLALMGSCCWLLNEKEIAVRWGHRVLPMARGTLVILNTAITLTNGVKPLAGWLVLHGRELDRKTLVRGVWTVLGPTLLVIGFYYFRSLLTGRGMGAGLAATLGWIPSERHLLQEIAGFFIRPIGFYQSFIVYPLAFGAIWRLILARRVSMLLLLASYFAVDVLIHIVIGWGMNEPWVFAPHWIWMLPILIGNGSRELKWARVVK